MSETNSGAAAVSMETRNLRYSMRKSVTPDAATRLLNQVLSLGKIREVDRAFGLFVHERLTLFSTQPDSAQPLMSSEEKSSEEMPVEGKSRHNEALCSAEQLLLVALAALTSEQLSRQHVCLEIARLGSGIQPWRPHFVFPEPDTCRRVLSSPAFNALGLMVFDGERLYLQRYWHYEQQVVKRLMHFTAPVFAEGDIGNCIEQLYTPETAKTGNADTGNSQPDWQKNAIALACRNSITVIAGGPGTGKTTTVVRILWSLCKLYQQMGKSDANIKMVAPTGKAAARLSESVTGATEKLPLAQNDAAVANIPKQCSTIHRLLGVIPNSVFFKHSQQRLLNIDVLVVDEASMIDLPLLAKLLSALPNHCRVILLGDSHQLASVEVGSVFSDICRLQRGHNGFSSDTCRALENITRQPLSDFAVPDRPEGDFADNILFLTKSWRFHANSGIGKLAKAVNSGDVYKTLDVLASNLPDLDWHTSISEQSLLNLVLPHFVSLHEAAVQEDPQQVFALLSQLQILTVQRKGKWGLQHINSLIRQALAKQGLTEVNQEFYPGRPVMVSSNDYPNRLFNGDVGVVMVDKQVLQQTGRTVYKVYFQDPEQGFRSLLPAQLPEHDTMFAMTTHKSQGSEYSKVIFCLPESENSGGNELLNRELLYTGVTRAKLDFVLFADKVSVSRAVQRVCQRASGLASVMAQYKL